ncbi:hypothetical protein ACUY2L_08550 [Corynebacterium mastitidis]
MENPWGKISVGANGEERSLVSHRDDLDNLRNLWANSEKTRLHLELPPEPFIGNVETAKVVVLLRDPGFDEGDRGVFDSDTFLKEYGNCIRSGGYEGGFYYFTPEGIQFPGDEWAKSVYGQIIKAGIGRLFPYVKGSNFNNTERGGAGKNFELDV